MKQYEKRYKEILPFERNMLVTTQFGWLPLSIVNPPKNGKKKWKDAYFEQDESEMRRSGGIQYLQNLKFSEFHAGLAENIVKYWSLKNSKIVDPFAGRATRAIVSTRLGRQYEGYEISPFTYTRSLEQYKVAKVNPTLHLADGTLLANTLDESVDLVFTCPPYYDIEQYEDVDGQLSSEKSYESFLSKIELCTQNIYRVLKPGAFCVWVCADFRGWHGAGRLITFHSDSINLFNKSGLITHDVIILQNQSPFAALQMVKVAAKRYTSKIHEYILVFRKPGDYIVPEYCQSDDINETANSFFEVG